MDQQERPGPPVDPRYGNPTLTYALRRAHNMDQAKRLACLCGISLWARPGRFCTPQEWARHVAHMARFERASHTPAFWERYRGE